MIARKTMVALLLALGLGSGIATWNAWHPDSCARYLRGETTLPSTQAVEMGAATVDVPCEQWYPRQTREMQTACVVELVAVGLLLVFAAGDGVNRWRVRKGRRRLEE